jgi:hypothetical protein
MNRPRPGTALKILALLFVVIAVESILKPFDTRPGMGFMLLGFRTDGLLEAIVARVHAALLLGLAYGIWRLKRYALYFLLAYTPYVLLNIILSSLRYDWIGIDIPAGVPLILGLSSPIDIPGPLFAIIWTLLSVGGPAGTAYLLSRRRLDLS